MPHRDPLVNHLQNRSYQADVSIFQSTKLNQPGCYNPFLYQQRKGDRI